MSDSGNEPWNQWGAPVQPTVNGWAPVAATAPGGDSMGSAAGWMKDGQFTTIDPSSVSNPLYQIAPGQAPGGDTPGSGPTYANPTQSGQYTAYQGFLEQALADPEFARLMADPNFNLSQYFSPHAAGADSAGALSGANAGMQKLMASNPNLQLRTGNWSPWASMEDFGQRQNARGGGFTAGLFDDLGDIAKLGLGTAGFGVGGTTGAAAATGNIQDSGDLKDYLTADAAGLAAGVGLSSMMAPTAGGGSAVAGAGVGEPISSQVAGTNLFGTASTPAMTTYAGPTGTSLGGFSAPAAMGNVGAGAAAAAPVAEALSGAPEITAPTAPSAPVAPDPMADAGIFSGMEPAQIANAGSSVSGAGQGIGIGLGAVRDGLSLGGGLYNLYQTNQTGQSIQDMLSQAQQQSQQQQFPHDQYRGLVDQYMKDPMSLLRNNPGFLESQRYLQEAGKRKMAGTGFTGSGNINYYLADTLGKNAQSWWKDMWTPIAESAGVKNSVDPASLAGVQANAMNTLGTNQRNALGSIGKASGDFLASNTGKKLFDWAFG